MVHPYFVTALKTTTLLMGGAITYFAYKAYNRTNAPALRSLAVGFALVTLGALLAGAIDLYAPSFDTSTVLVVESALNTVGFGVILYSLFSD